MTTYAVLKSRIADEIGRTDLTSNIASAILTAVKHYERRRFYFNETTNTFNTVADQEYYGSAALSDIPNIIQIDSMYVTVNSVRMPMRPTLFETIDAAQTGSVTGTPERFCTYKQQIRLYPIPSAANTVTLAYLKKLTALSADGDSNAWTTDAEELIRESAKRRLFTSVLFDMEAATGCGAIEEEALEELLAETRRRRVKAPLMTDVPRSYSTFDINTG